MTDRNDLDVDLIHVYTRAQAIEDGVLVDVSETAREAGFSVPVALTSAVFADCVEWDAETAARSTAMQDERGRLWDVLWMASLAARRSGAAARTVYTIRRHPRPGSASRRQLVQLVAVIGPGDAGEPVVTIMTTTED